MQFSLLKTEQGNRQCYLFTLDTSNDNEVSEECTISTPDGLTVTMIKGKKKKESLLSTLFKKAIPYAENLMKLIKLIFLLILLLLPDIS